jgi:hypothetical protein
MLTVASCPACSVPEVAERFTPPIRLTGSEILQDTGPPSASMVSVLLPSAVSSTVVGETVSVPGEAAVVGGADLAGVAEGDAAGDADFDAAGDVLVRVGDVLAEAGDVL